MVSTRFFQCMCTATAAVLLGQAPQTALAFAPSLNTPTKTAVSSRHLSRPSAIPTTTSPAPSFQTNRGMPQTSLQMSEQNESNQSSLPVFLDPGTKGGALVLSLILFVIPIIIYQVATGVFGMDEVEVGRDLGVGFSVITMLLWGSTYIFRVATKDMTYAKQLKDYEDAVIAKRLEELDEDEVQALVEDIEREQF
mmetsp:Transcript_25678/g.54246  ORF Transcript_25678/g.54246 Transcript_25678/m.54246 type:complete len:195 (-) Transcript_25678:286-870(-)|eukprot:CAMPEP_0183726450 /NCGR_PEP_ID=MMETSP0737-20130205/23216_1 /TAXON_ID=385413 /ORGANISM="Thalassiosira miniscula, Strain CCMP1093" /LENGTH=194 /DNA_ID=CAMNT_0025957789 /DNA_START=52 /DNA_END=636 /DNA_ORIENTATION=-